VNQGTQQVLCQIRDLLATLDLEVDPAPSVVVPPCQPCMAVDGVVDPNVTLAYFDQVATYLHPTGVLDPASVEILSPCDERCRCVCTSPEECDCDCSPEDLAAVAIAVGGK